MKGNHLPFKDEIARMEVYNRGLLDRQAAKELMISKDTFAQWRISRGLPANGGSGWGGRRANTKYWRVESARV